MRKVMMVALGAPGLGRVVRAGMAVLVVVACMGAIFGVDLVFRACAVVLVGLCGLLLMDLRARLGALRKESRGAAARLTGRMASSAQAMEALGKDLGAQAALTRRAADGSRDAIARLDNRMLGSQEMLQRVEKTREEQLADLRGRLMGLGDALASLEGSVGVLDARLAAVREYLHGVDSEVTAVEKTLRKLTLAQQLHVQTVQAFIDQRGSQEDALSTELYGRLDMLQAEIAEESKTLGGQVEDGASAVLKGLREGDASVASGRAELRALGDRLTEQCGSLLWNVRTDNPSRIATEVQAVLQLRDRFGAVAPLPLVGGWAIEASALVGLVDLVQKRSLSHVVECGSGTSTLWFAYALRSLGKGRLTSLEHLPEFAERTRSLLEAHGLAEWVDLVEAPLASVTIGGEGHGWYAVDADSLPSTIDLLLVDGPPVVRGAMTRYPALPVLRSRLAPNALVAVDDCERSEEQAVIRRWSEEYPELTCVTRLGTNVQVFSLASER